MLIICIVQTTKMFICRSSLPISYSRSFSLHMVFLGVGEGGGGQKTSSLHIAPLLHAMLLGWFYVVCILVNILEELPFLMLEILYYLFVHKKIYEALWKQDGSMLSVRAPPNKNGSSLAFSIFLSQDRSCWQPSSLISYHKSEASHLSRCCTYGWVGYNAYTLFSQKTP